MIKLRVLENGFKYLEIENELSNAKIALQGAHLFAYGVKSEEPIIWISDKSRFTLGSAIRGGIPICWPWFGAHTEDTTLPKHGFARTSMFDYEIVKDEKALSQIRFVLKDSQASLSLWPYKFELSVLISVSDTLQIELTTKNCDTKSFTLTQALHSYFSVSDIAEVSIVGLDNKIYFDSLLQRESQQDEPLFIDQEIDRIYKDSSNEIEIIDKQRSIQIKTQGSNSTVVWNPWISKSQSMSDMGANSYRTMLCVESANALDDFKTINRDENDCLKTIISNQILNNENTKI